MKGSRLTLVSEDGLQAAWLQGDFSSEGVTSLLVSYSQNYKGSFQGSFFFFFLTKTDTCKVTHFFKTFPTSKNITL